MSTMTKRITMLALLVAVAMFTFSGPAQGSAAAWRVRVQGRAALELRPRRRSLLWSLLGFLLGSVLSVWLLSVHRNTLRCALKWSPKHAEVFVNGSFCRNGRQAAHDAWWPRHHLVSARVSDGHGEHLRGAGFHVPGSDTMDRLAAGEVSAPPPMPARPAIQESTPEQG